MYIAWAIRDGSTMTIFVRLMHLFVVNMMYQALLQVCFLLEDPLGDDVTDFPMMSFQIRIYTESKKLLQAVRAFWDIRRREVPRDNIWPPAPPAPQPAPAPAPQLDMVTRVENEVSERFQAQLGRHVGNITTSVDEAC